MKRKSRQIPAVTAFFIINSNVDPLRPSLSRHGDRTNSGSRRNRVSGVVKVFSLHHHAGQGGKMGRQ
jgi:hypothetical protein